MKKVKEKEVQTTLLQRAGQSQMAKPLKDNG